MDEPIVATGALDDAAEPLPGTPDAGRATADAGPMIPELLTLEFDTTPNGGNYAPKNIVAVWIEAADGTFVKTISRWAGSRRSHLVAWVQKSGQDTDAISGATRRNHTETLSVVWNLKNRAGQIIPDGTYTIRMELADRNASSSSQNHQGTFTFVKNGVAATQMVSGGGFENVVIDYTGR